MALPSSSVPHVPGDRVYVVIPAYREAPAIRRTVEAVRRVYPLVVVVDDGSDDGTGREALAAGALVATHPVNLGQGAALQTGIELALRRGADYVVTFDADGQHRVADVQAMLSELMAGDLDVVLGSRFLGRAENLPLPRRMLLKAAVVFTNLTCGIRLTDTHNGLRAMTAAAAARVEIRHAGMARASELLAAFAAAKLRVKEVPVTVLYTDYSLRKGQRLSGALRILADLLMGWIAR